MTVDKELDQVGYQVREVIRRLEIRDTEAHRAFAETHRKLWAAHQPVAESAPLFCSICGDAWPCGVVKGLMVG